MGGSCERKTASILSDGSDGAGVPERGEQVRQLFLPPGKGVLLKNAKEEKGNYVDYEKEPERLSGAEQPRDLGRSADLGLRP